MCVRVGVMPCGDLNPCRLTNSSLGISCPECMAFDCVGISTSSDKVGASTTHMSHSASSCPNARIHDRSRTPPQHRFSHRCLVKAAESAPDATSNSASSYAASSQDKHLSGVPPARCVRSSGLAAYLMSFEAKTKSRMGFAPVKRLSGKWTGDCVKPFAWKDVLPKLDRIREQARENDEDFVSTLLSKRLENSEV